MNNVFDRFAALFLLKTKLYACPFAFLANYVIIISINRLSFTLCPNAPINPKKEKEPDLMVFSHAWRLKPAAGSYPNAGPKAGPD